jgi:hypothetical protein
LEAHSFISLEELTKKLAMLLIAESGLSIASFLVVYLRWEFPLVDMSQTQTPSLYFLYGSTEPKVTFMRLELLELNLFQNP